MATEQNDIPTPSTAEQMFSADRARQIALEEMRVAKMKEVAAMRWNLARYHHRFEDGKKMDFERWPFLTEIYQSEAQEQVLVGSAGWGKSQYLIVDSAAKSLCALRNFYVLDKYEKREKFVLGTVDPIFAAVPAYQLAQRGAHIDRSAMMDSSRFKHFGDGSINFIGANSEGDFTTYRADSVSVDEHQDCDLSNLRLVFDRMSGSDYNFTIYAGHPSYFGSEENQNLDWLYRQTDQRMWQVPCPHCGVYQCLGWWSHFVEEKKNQFGAIMTVKVRDVENETGDMDPRPVCTNCSQPMLRLSDQGQWVPLVPGAKKRGYKLSNLYNPTVRMRKLLEHYLTGLHDPHEMGKFVNRQLGEPYNVGGTKLTDDMLQAASTAKNTGVQAYRFVPTDQIEWRDLAVA